MLRMFGVKHVLGAKGVATLNAGGTAMLGERWILRLQNADAISWHLGTCVTWMCCLGQKHLHAHATPALNC